MNRFGKVALALSITLPTGCEPSVERAPAPAKPASANGPPSAATPQAPPAELAPPAEPPAPAEPPPEPLPVFTLARLVHDAPVTDLAWSADGAVIVTASSDGKRRIWDAHSHTLTRTVQGSPGPAARVGVSANGATLVANAEHEVHVFDGDTGELRLRLSHEAPVLAVGVSADATTIASGGDDGLRIWTADGAERRHVKHRGAGVSCLQLSANGLRLASGWADGRVRLIDAQTGKVQRTIEASEAPASLAYSGNGERVAARIGAGQLGIFATATGKRSATIPVAHPFGFGADGNLMLATGEFEGSEFSVALIDVNSGGIVRGFLGHTDAVTDAAFSPDGGNFASASADTTVLIWAAP
ncbi:High-affnity carbon uptake protein Hat/HatR [Enhygromyxa salina]|uniref:High-affnity carbon uptake protein Hat/HatR n=1 Tax=Enhygromyxa salina TaxID=215803 RepID=A0A0C1ZHH2_9BACT|nr:WD40 repeat domain-containing protein [Enhygromyxa salina]KIG17054.1 High-affnity carbon uptake protein Hat/HatR [Enhygromyxa salina]